MSGVVVCGPGVAVVLPHCVCRGWGVAAHALMRGVAFGSVGLGGLGFCWEVGQADVPHRCSSHPHPLEVLSQPLDGLAVRAVSARGRARSTLSGASAALRRCSQ